MARWQGREIAYGGDYNPEQWDEATIAEDIELMVAAGVNLVTLGVFAWARYQPVEGAYDFAWMRQIMDRLEAAGIGVDLATGTASPPAWLARNYPASLPVTANGVRLGFGSRQQYCPNSPEFRTAAAGLVERLAEELGDHPALRLWHTSNEYGAHVWECFCERCAAAFRLWLERRYGRIEELNRSWGTAFWSQEYSEFGLVSPPAAMPTFHNPGQMADWRRFCSDSLLQLHRAEVAILRAATPQVPITTNFMGWHPWIDYWQWAREVDVVSDDSYPEPADPAAVSDLSLVADLMRSLKGQPYLLMEQAPTGIQWRDLNTPKRAGVNALWSLTRLGHGADGILHFQWRQSVRGSETFHSGMVCHAGREGRAYREICALGEDLGRAGEIVGSEFVSEVALLWDWQSEWGREAAIGPSAVPWALHLRRWYRTLFEAGYQVDFLPTTAAQLPGQGETDLAAAYGRYRLIVVPGVFALDRATVAALEAAARAGTQVLVAAPSGYVDLEVCAYTDRAPSGLAALSGVRMMESWPATVDTSPRPTIVAAMADAPHPLVDRVTRALDSEVATAPTPLSPAGPLARALDEIAAVRPDLWARTWAEDIRIEADDVEVLASYQAAGFAAQLAGAPAITYRGLGQGGCHYTSAELDAVGRAALLRVAAARARVAPAMRDLPDGVHVSRRGDYLFLTNHSDRTVELKGMVGQLLLAGEAASGHIALAPRSGEILRLP